MNPQAVFVYVVDETKDEVKYETVFHFKSYARCHVQSTLQLMGVKQRDADSITDLLFDWLTKANELKQQIQSDVIVSDGDEDEVEFLAANEEDEDYGDNEDDRKVSSISTPSYSHATSTQKSRLQKVHAKICALHADNQNIKLEKKSINTSVVKILSAYLIRNERNKLMDKRHTFKTKNYEIDIASRNDIIFVTRKQFEETLSVALAIYEYSRPSRKDDLKIACQIRERKRPLIVLFGGTSGCGKSTLASLLASRLGITKVLSTDSVRHMLRGFISKEENPILFASTYHAGECLRGDSRYSHLTEDELVIEGYRQQCKIVVDQLDKIIFNCQKHNEPLVVEGVHLLPDFMIELMKKYPNSIVPYVIYISNDLKHKERFAFRAKYMTLEPRNNKYVQYFEHIRQIQSYICGRADSFAVPKIDNTNIDRSLATIHASVFKSIKRVATDGDPLYDPESDKANVSSTYTQPIFSSNRMLKLIQKKRSSLDKDIAEQITIVNVSRDRSTARARAHNRVVTDDDEDTVSTDSESSNSGEQTVTDEDETDPDAVMDQPVRFSPKLARFERNHKRLIRNRKKLQFAKSPTHEKNKNNQASSESEDDGSVAQQSSDTDAAIGSLSEFSDAVSRHADYFQESD